MFETSGFEHPCYKPPFFPCWVCHARDWRGQATQESMGPLLLRNSIIHVFHIYCHFFSLGTQLNPRAACIHCNDEMPGIAAHLEKQWKILRREEESHSSEQPPKKTKQETLQVVTTTPLQIQELNMQMARFICVAGLPCWVADNEPFRLFVKMLRPGVSLAARKQVIIWGFFLFQKFRCWVHFSTSYMRKQSARQKMKCEELW